MRARTRCSLPSAVLTYETPVARPSLSVVTSRAIAPVIELEPARRQRRRQQHRRRGEIRVRRAAAAALPAVVAGRPAVQRLGQDRQPRRDAGDAQALGALLHHQLVAARLRRRLEDAVGLVGQALRACRRPRSAGRSCRSRVRCRRRRSASRRRGRRGCESGSRTARSAARCVPSGWCARRASGYATT